MEGKEGPMFFNNKDFIKKQKEPKREEPDRNE